MINIIALTLMLASMASAGVWSPTPHADRRAASTGEEVIMKGGHRAVVVEYADDNAGQGNTKVLISPPLTSSSVEDQLSSAAAAVAGVSQDAKKAAMEAHGWAPGDLICDAFGKCKHKITGTIYRAKNKVTETAQEVEEGAKETVDSVIDKAKEFSTNAAEQGTEKAKRSVSRAKETAEDAAEEVKNKGKATIEKAKEAAQDSAEKLKHKIDKAEEAAEKTTKEISDIARRGKEVLYDVVSYMFPKEFFKSVMGFVHLLGFSTAFGTAAWVTFAMSHLLARSLPRQQFGLVQSRVYPVYFKALASFVGLALLGHLMDRTRRPAVSNVAWRLQVYNLVGSIALVLVNLLYLEPRATKVMYERMKIEKEEGRGVSVQATRLVDHMDSPMTTTGTTTTPRREEGGELKSKMERLNKRLRKLNSYSSLLNVITLMGLIWHLVYLSQRLCV